jgi:aspartyl-tRNA(Asn)/glutamyl-tRNA(Gln) amidotransferase subunit B
MSSAKEAVAYMKKMHSLVRYLEISDGNMAEGSFRCDANVSVRPKGQKELGTRREIKNINSFRFVERAINVEIEKQIDIIENGGTVKQETRLYDAEKNDTRRMRSKEEANDYRYFPDPDLLPLELDDEFIESVRDTLPELPDQKKKRFIADYELSTYDAEILTSSRELAAYFEKVTEISGQPKLATNWVNGDFAAMINKENLEIKDSPISAEDLGVMVKYISDGTITGKIAKKVFEGMWAGEGNADTVIDKHDLKPITDTAALEKIIDNVLASNPKQLEQYKGGQDRLFGYFVGQVMKASKGKADPAQVNKIIKDKLS